MIVRNDSEYHDLAHYRHFFVTVDYRMWTVSGVPTNSPGLSSGEGLKAESEWELDEITMPGYKTREHAEDVLRLLMLAHAAGESWVDLADIETKAGVWAEAPGELDQAS